MGIAEVLGAPRSPWQRAYVERMIGSIRRDCLDDLIVFDESSLRRLLRRYFDYYHESRTHLSLDKDAPISRLRHADIALGIYAQEIPESVQKTVEELDEKLIGQPQVATAAVGSGGGVN